MSKREQIVVPQLKRPYSAPYCRSEKVFETTALACGKCTTGPFPQFQCSALLKTS